MKNNNTDDGKVNFELILRSVPGYVYWKDRNSVYLGCNRNAAAVLGLAKTSDIVGKTEADFPWGNIAEIVDKAQADDQRVIETGGSFITEDRLTIINEQGLEIILRTEKAPLFDEDQNIIGVLGIGIDITMQKFEEQQKLEQVAALEKYYAEKILIEQETIFSLLETAVSETTGQTFLHRLPAQYYIDEIRNFLENVILKMPGYVFLKDKNFKYLFCNETVNNEFLGLPSPKEVLGKTDYDFGWSKALVDSYRKIDAEIIRTGQPVLGIEEVVYTNVGVPLVLYVNKMPIFNKMGEVIGIIGINIDITAQKEAERLRLGFELNKHALEEQEKFRKIVDQVAHDIRSPLASLLMVVKVCNAIPENERIALREAATNINDIANNLLSAYGKKESDSTPCSTEEREAMLVSPVLSQILTDKKYQYQNLPIKFAHHFTQAGNFSWINVNSTSFKRMLSNIINNAVDAFDQKEGKITLHLDADSEQVRIVIEDNGKGMNAALVQKIMNDVSVTEGKKDGHGIGLTQVRETLQNNDGLLGISSTIGIGTKIMLTFPKVESQIWIAENIQLNEEDTVVILDDDSSIHLAWDSRFDRILKIFSNLKVKHFEMGREAVDFINRLTPEEKNNVFLLADYELLKQNLTGLDVIKDTHINRSILVTSHYVNKSIRLDAVKIGTKILPKQLAYDIPINITPTQVNKYQSQAWSGLKEIDAVFVDDDKNLLNAFIFFAADKEIDTYHDPQDFLKNVSIYPLKTKIFIDHNFSHTDVKGIQIIEQLYAKGFVNLYLLSGAQFDSDEVPLYATAILKTDIDQVGRILKSK